MLILPASVPLEKGCNKINTNLKKHVLNKDEQIMSEIFFSVVGDYLEINYVLSILFSGQLVPNWHAIVFPLNIHHF